MKKRTIIIIVTSIALNLILAWQLLYAGNTDSPGVPSATNSYTVEDIYQRFNAGTAGAQSTFSEPGVAAGTGTMHTLNEIMGVAPTLDNTNGTTITQVASGKTFWGLTSGQWAVQTGTLTSACSVVNVTGYNFGVRVTGDTYITSTVDGEDGELQNGVAWPNPRFTDSCDGTITDNLTGLVWLQDANCFGTTTWATALSSANTLASGACGLTDGSVATDWRLPNVEELASLTHFGFVSPTLPNTAGTGQWTAGDPFDNVSSGYYWSGSQSFYSDGAWSVSMGQGNVVFTFKSVGGSTRVWPVRDGAP